MTNHSVWCPVCKSNNWVIDLVAAQMLGLKPPYEVIHCETCGLGRLSPQLTNEELDVLYSDGYFNSGQTKQAPEQYIKTASSDYIGEIAPSRHAQFYRTIERLKQLHPTAVTFLDVGAATGDMVKIAKESGLVAEGVEFSTFAVRKAKELYEVELQQIAIADLDKAGHFDLIHLNHVFEHFNDPEAELGHLHRLLKSGGCMFVEVPYQFNFLEKLRFKLKGRQAQFSVESLHHPFFYTPATICAILQKHGFEVEKCSVFDPDRYPSNTFLQKIKRILWELFSFVSIGNYIAVFAKRKP